MRSKLIAEGRKVKRREEKRRIFEVELVCKGVRLVIYL